MTLTRRGFLLALAAAPAAVVGCQGGRDFRVFGYSTAAPFDPNVKTVHVPAFKNLAFLTQPYRDIEVELTSAVVKEINSRTPWRVTSNRDAADTELLCTLVKLDKVIQNRNPQNIHREYELVLTVQVVWKDLRTGKVLSNPTPPGPAAVPAEPFDPSLPLPEPDAPREKAVPVVVVAAGRVLQELGESNTTGQKMAVDKTAQQIVNMMERPW